MYDKVELEAHKRNLSQLLRDKGNSFKLSDTLRFCITHVDDLIEVENHIESLIEEDNEE